jgi:hypothetical protein
MEIGSTDSVPRIFFKLPKLNSASHGVNNQFFLTCQFCG